ncbi:Ppx/GppA phosphatase family protein [Exilibacterium tricleocarpae]|nr:Ppx/GppA phosphatase family protein [Exilibacterium tricleocarpae]
MPANEPSYFVAVDLGSNSFHMLIAREKDGALEIVDRVKDMVQIARGLGRDGNLSTEAQARAILCLECFSERIRQIPSSRVRAVGTKTLRAARNAEQFLRRAEAALGQPIQIISGYEEARLVYLGVSHSIVDDHRKRLVIDIGGGSTEFIIGHNLTPQHLESLSIGCVTYAERYLQQGVTADAMGAAYLAACNELELIRNDYRNTGWDIVYGASGTMRVIAELMPNHTAAAVITRQGLNNLIEQTINDGEVGSPSVSKLRRDVLPAGLAILKAIFSQLQLTELHVADATLKEGLIYDSLGRMGQRDTRDQTVEMMSNRYQIDRAQAARVQDTALALLGQLSPTDLRGLAPEKLLCWAAQLHEIGLSVSHSGHHHHGHYLLKHSDMAGFSRYDQQLLARLVRFHRRKLLAEPLDPLHESEPAHTNTAGLSGDDPLLPLVLCLRLAVLLNRARETVDCGAGLDWRDNRVHISFTPGWLDQHPLTARSLSIEADYLAGVGLTLSF